MLKKNVRIGSWLCVSMLVGGAVAQAKKGHKAHEHGAATLSVAIDGLNIAISGELPGDDAFGFEHPPRNDKEKAAITDAMATLRTKALELFQLPADAGCTLATAKIESPLEAYVTGAPVKPVAEVAPKAGKKGEDHNDVDTDYRFTCLKTPAGGTMKLGLLKAFPRLKTVRMQIISGATQSGQTVHSADDVIKL